MLLYILDIECFSKPLFRRTNPMNVNNIKHKYPAARFHPVLVTEVTRMNKGFSCIAAWDIHEERIVRPLQYNGDNWQLASDHSLFFPGHLLNCSPSGRVRSVLPHAHEDFILTRLPTLLERFDEAETYKLLIDKTDSSVSSVYGQRIVEDKYIVEGTNCKSLGSIRSQRRNIKFFQDMYGKLRLRLQDLDGIVYILPVTSDELLRAFSPTAEELEPHFGVDEANEWLEVNAPEQHLILRIGLARGWSGKDNAWVPKRCYVQLNGIICPSDNWAIFAGPPNAL